MNGLRRLTSSWKGHGRKLKGRVSCGVPARVVETINERQRRSWANILSIMDLRQTIPNVFHAEAHRMRDEIVRQRIDECDAASGIGDMLDDYDEAHFGEGPLEEEPEASTKAF